MGYRIPGSIRGYRGMPKHQFMLRKSYHMQRWNIRNPWIRPLCTFNRSAIIIQALIRGFIIRKLGPKWRLKIIKRPRANKTQKQLDKYLNCLDYYQSRKKLKPLWLDNGYSAWCCVRIQCWWRMIKTYRHVSYQKHSINHIAAIVIQEAYRAYSDYKKWLELQQLPEYSPDQAALVVQMKWRSFSNRRIYFFYRDLILFKLKGAPDDLLRNIIPHEVGYMDRAAGIHVRFRLGGSIFPPKIMFKIFTHRGICDVNAFAPRDYTQEKPHEDFHTNNKSLTANSKDQTAYPTRQLTNIRVGASYFGTLISTTNPTGEGWYRRIENNPWRPIASSLAEEITIPPWQRDKLHELPPKPYHFSRLRRMQDVKKRKKHRRRQWLKKAYMMANNNATIDSTFEEQERRFLASNISQSQMLDDGSSSLGPKVVYARGGNNNFLSEGSQNQRSENNERLLTKNPFTTLGAHGSIHESSIAQDDPISPKKKPLRDDFGNEEDLLRWSMALDFNEYAKDWSSLATSMPSDMDIGTSMSLSGSFMQSASMAASSSGIKLPPIRQASHQR